MSLSKLLLGVSGIAASYLINSILIEKIFTYEYYVQGSSEKHFFQYSDLVQLFVNVFCITYAWSSIKIRKEGASPLPNREVLILGLLYFVNMTSINYCLYYIPYPMRVVGDKLVYLVSVIIGVYFSRVSNKTKLKLGKQKVLIAILITVGTLMFSYFYTVSKQSQVLYNRSEMWIGFVLLGISIIAESLFSDSQAFNKITYKPTISHLLLCVNLMGFIFSFTTLLIKNQLVSSLTFCLEHKQILLDLFAYGSLTIVGQVSAYFIILNFRQHIFPLISTGRKVITVLLSIYIYNHPTNMGLWISLVLVFGGLVFQMADELQFDLFKFKSRKSEKKQ